MKLFKKITLSLMCAIFAVSSFVAINSVITTNKSKKVLAATREENLELALARAEYILNYRWTPTRTLGGWGTTFYAGNQYTIPYSQPYMYGGYLFYNITLEQFEQYAASGSNGFYDYHNNGGQTTACPRYGLDCSAFASFCLGVPTRCTTYTFETWANNGSNGFYYKNFNTVSRGDLLNSNSVGHVLVVGEVNGDNVSCYESTPQYRSGRADICYTTKTKAQWQSIGYNVLGYDYRGTGAPLDDVTTNRLGAPAKDNHVLGDCTSGKADTSWDLTKNYSPNNILYSARTAVLNSAMGDNILYFNQTNSTHVTAQAKFTATGKTSSELWGKFGISLINDNGNGLFFYCNASGTEGTGVENITGTKVGIIRRDATSSWKWGTEIEVDNKWSASSPVTLKLERIGGYFKCYVDNEVVFTGIVTDYGLGVEESVYPSIRSFNTYLSVSEYSSYATHNSFVIDGDLSDWQANENWDTILADKKSVADKTDTNKNATFYHRLTDEGLFVYAIANHTQTTSGSENWWENTNFEMFINSSEDSAQYFVSEDLVQGFTSFAFRTK
ncbi:MAG: hypothetical protein J6C97_05030, partial [Clostridia bacterium]|nr:hypothetical protein [Clostridia bacterium]